MCYACQREIAILILFALLSRLLSSCATSSVLLMYLLHTSFLHLKYLLCVRVHAKGQSKIKKKAVCKSGADSGSAGAPEHAEVCLDTVRHYSARRCRSLMSLAINPRRDACLLLLKQAFRYCLPTFMSRCSEWAFPCSSSSV